MISIVGNGPLIANSINYIPAVEYNASGNVSDANYLQIENAAFLNDTDYTIFVLEKRLSSADDNETIILGYSSDTNVLHYQGSGSNYSSTIESYANYTNKGYSLLFLILL